MQKVRGARCVCAKLIILMYAEPKWLHVNVKVVNEKTGGGKRCRPCLGDGRGARLHWRECRGHGRDLGLLAYRGVAPVARVALGVS